MAKLTKHNCLAVVNPKLCREWDYEKNDHSNPHDFSYSSAKIIWWKCQKCGREWQAQIRHRNRGWYKCFYCYKSLKSLCPELAKEWDYKKNYPLRPENVSRSDRRVAHWICSKCGNKFKSKIAGRQGFKKKDFKCSKCHWTPKKNRSLSEINPKLAKEWHPTKNGKLTPDNITFSNSKKVWWKCPRCHRDFRAAISNRNIGGNCPKCCWDIANKPSAKKSLLFKYPKICKDWDYKRNGLLVPQEIAPNIYRKVYWQCHKCNYKWMSPVLYRTQGLNKCFRCNSLGALNPDAAKNWHPTKNKKLTPFDVTPDSPRKVWWKCHICGYVWCATIGSQKYTLGCPTRSKILLKDGTICDSILDAYIYLNCKENNIAFKYNKRYGSAMGNSRYDFYFAKDRIFLEVTSFNKTTNIINWPKYLRKIVEKKHFVENVLDARFIFVQFNLRTPHIRYIKEYIRKHLRRKCSAKLIGGNS